MSFRVAANVAVEPLPRCTEGERSEPFVQRAGLCVDVELVFRLPGTAAWLFDKVKSLLPKLVFIGQA